MIRKLSLLFVLLVSLGFTTVQADTLPYSFTPNMNDQASLQRGAKLFMNYCSGCHTLSHIRYNRIADDLNIPEEVMQNNLMMTSDKIGDQIDGTMSDKAEDWFGSVPPDLSLKAREVGADWLYSFLMTFYADDTRVTGMNNLVLENTSMPWPLWQLQGVQELESTGDDSSEPEFSLAQEGDLSPEQFEQAAGDIVNFLAYVGEPMQKQRVSVGIKVIIFLLIFTIIAYLLKREYWKDVH